MTPERRIIRDLAQIDSLEEDVRELVKKARELESSKRAKSRRVAAKRAPSRKAKAATKAERQARTAAVRAAVFARDGGRCICGAEATDLHHCLSGPDRMAKEHERTCLAVCRVCHRMLHDGDLPRLSSALSRCRSHGLANAAAAIERRITKIVALRVG